MSLRNSLVGNELGPGNPGTCHRSEGLERVFQAMRCLNSGLG